MRRSYTISDNEGLFWDGTEWDSDLSNAARWTSLRAVSILLGKLASDGGSITPLFIRCWAVPVEQA